jgi:hypothetical protein
MKSILHTCEPRPDILQGTFNPEIFTASLGQVLTAYNRDSALKTIYTDPEVFFREATYPTQGLISALLSVFGRISGNASFPAIQRLETAFGGGKTHSLIAMTHIAKQGQKLAPQLQDILPEDYLPEPAQVHVVGVAGDELPVHKPQGAELTPYTLWGEIAYQIGGEQLYRQVEAEVTSYAAPGRHYFQTVLGDTKALIMLDELAQYATRLQAARPDGADQLAAFLMGLHGFARNNTGIAIVLTLASSVDAFSRQSSKLGQLISDVRGEDIDEAQAVALAQEAEQGIRSVVARDASTVVPVQGGEISRILAKRLFRTIDHDAAEEIAQAYLNMYRDHSSSLPSDAIQEDFRQTLISHYPFHPTFIRFLNGKLSSLETFQGTRGVLRVLTLVIRTLWENQVTTPMIHTCHLDMQNAQTVDELIGRTGGADLLPVLNTDIGGPDTGTLSTGTSYARMADQRNPHPKGYPLYEYTWKTVFVHSLVGRSEGLGSNLFGISEQEALFAVSNPDIPPTQVQKALEEIENSAQYLRKSKGRYYASLEPSVNRALSSIRTGIRNSQVQERLKATARNVVKKDIEIFRVIHDVAMPEEIPDKGDKPILGLVDLSAEEISAEEFVTMAGQNKARERQNLVLLLVPKTVREKSETWSQNQIHTAQDSLTRMDGLARTVLARKRLQDKPEDYGINSVKLAEQDFTQKSKEREQALLTTVTQCYDALWFPAASGQVVRKEIKTSGGEGGISVIEEIKRVLKQEGELITSEIAQTQECLHSLQKLFFKESSTPRIQDIKKHFACKRTWPILESPQLSDQIIRSGIERGVWCLFRMKPGSEHPDDFFSRDTGPLPMEIDLSDPEWSLIAQQKANQLGWGPVKIDREKVKSVVYETVANNEAAPIKSIFDVVKDKMGDVPETDVSQAVGDLVRQGRLGLFSGSSDQEEKPADLKYGPGSFIPTPEKEQVLITPASISKRGWKKDTQKFSLSGKKGANKIFPLLKSIGTLYSRGATSEIEILEFTDLEIPGGGKMRVSLEDVPPEAMKNLDEFFDLLGDLFSNGPDTEADLTVTDPDEDCLLLQKLK